MPAALAGHDAALAECFQIVLRREQASAAENILIHRVAGQQQLGGVDPGLKWLGLAGIALALQSGGGYESAPREGVKNSTRLDGWQGRYPIRIAACHNAVADALGSAQLLGALPLACAAHGHSLVGALDRLADQFRWLR